ncbi:MFS transporter [Bacillaceae bacterium Marseille-Q3522]|nr:MFS transporter [Bacillaceae bacterium Marseille-Q3522]
MNISTSVNKSRFWVLGSLFFAWFIGYFDRLAINLSIIPISEEFQLTSSQAGLILSSFFLGYSIMQLFGGWFADKFGSRKVLITCILAWSIFTALSGFAWSFLSLLFVRFVFGLGEGPFSAASSVAIAENFPREGRARAKSVLLSSYKLAGIIGSVGAASLLILYGWRNMFYFLGILGLISVIFVWIYLPKRNQQNDKSAAEKISVKKLAKMPMIWTVLIVWFGLSMVNWGLATWMPSYLAQIRNMNLLDIGIFSMIPATVGFLSTIFFGWILDKFMDGKEKYLLIIGSIFTAGFLYFMFNSSGIIMAFVFWSLCELSFASVFVTIFALPLKYMPDHYVGSATGMINFGGQMAGVISPAVIGFMVSAFNGSYHAAFWFLIVAALISVIAGSTLQTSKKEGNNIDNNSSQTTV